MSMIELRRKAQASLEKLPANKVRIAAEFLAYLGHHASDEATAELRQIPGILGDLKRARREYDQKKGTNWRKVRTDV